MSTRRYAAAFAAFLLSACVTIGGEPSLYGDLSDRDVQLASLTVQEALETARHGEARTWTNPETGTRGAVTPLRTIVSDGGYFCRNYRETLVVGEREASYDNRACRNDDGRWVWVE